MTIKDLQRKNVILYYKYKYKIRVLEEAKELLRNFIEEIGGTSNKETDDVYFTD